MSSDKTSTKYKTLLSDGPKTAEQLGGHPAVDERRLYDIQKFNPRDQTTAIWYLEDHDTEQILRLWFDVNQQALESNGVNKRSLSYSLNGEWMEVWQDIRDEYEWLDGETSESGGSNEQGEQTCPKCGKDDVKNLPRHLRGGSGGDE